MITLKHFRNRTIINVVAAIPVSGLIGFIIWLLSHAVPSVELDYLQVWAWMYIVLISAWVSYSISMHLSMYFVLRLYSKKVNLPFDETQRLWWYLGGSKVFGYQMFKWDEAELGEHLDELYAAKAYERVKRALNQF